jgi:hypothetical protein
MTPSEIKPVTFRLVAQSLNQLCYRMPPSPQHAVLKFLHSPFCHLKQNRKESSSENQTTCKILTATTEKDILIPNKMNELKFQRFGISHHPSGT